MLHGTQSLTTTLLIRVAVILVFGAEAVFLQTPSKFADLKAQVFRFSIYTRRFHWFRPFNDRDVSGSLGSGFLVRSDPPLICTCAHVVDDADKVYVQVPMLGRMKFQATVATINGDADVALVVLNEPQKLLDILKERDIELKALTPAEQTPPIGHSVIAPGFPLGQNTMTLSTGVISGVDHVDFHHRNLAIQSTAIISSGNSGSPLLDGETGALIGMNYAKMTGEAQINYVVPLWVLKQTILKHEMVHTSKVPDTHYQIRLVDHGLTITPGSDALYMMSSGGDTCNSGPLISAMFPSSPFGGAQPPVKSDSFLISIAGVKLDRYGQGAKSSYVDEKVDFDDLMRMRDGTGEEEIAFETCDASTGQSQSHRMNLTWKDSRDGQGIRYVYEPWREGVDYEVFGDLLFMNLTENHIRYLGGGWHYLLQPDERHIPKLAVLVHQNGGAAEEALNLHQGVQLTIVDTINGHKVSSLDDLRWHFYPKQISAGTQVISSKVTNTDSAVVPVGLHNAGGSKLRGAASSFSAMHRKILNGDELLWSMRTLWGRQFVALFKETLASQLESAKRGRTYLITQAPYTAMTSLNLVPPQEAQEFLNTGVVPSLSLSSKRLNSRDGDSFYDSVALTDSLLNVDQRGVMELVDLP